MHTRRKNEGNWFWYVDTVADDDEEQLIEDQRMNK